MSAAGPALPVRSSAPRVGLDLTLLRPDRLTGVERYAQNLARALIETQGDDFEWVLFFRGEVPPSLQGLAGRFEACVSTWRNRVLTDQLWLPRAARRARLDLLHAPAYPVSPAYRGRFVVTVCDAAMWRYPATLSRGARFYYRPLFPQAIRRAERVLTISHFSQRELCAIFGLPESRVAPIVMGLDVAFDPPPEPRREASEPFVLTVGTVEPRKNLRVLLEALELLPARHAGVRLRVVGRRGWQDPRQLPPSARTDWLGSLEDRKLLQLYRTATVFALPSLYEGFGLPLLEAMSQGAPALASRAASLPEVGGEAAVYADPLSAAEWAARLTELLDQPRLRDELSARGRARSQLYTWQQTAHQTAEVYREVLGEAPRSRRAAAPRSGGRVRILGTEVDRLGLSEAEERIAALVDCGRGGLIVTPNVDHLLTLRRDAEFRTIYRSAALVLADGMPVVWASRLFGRAVPERVAGSDLLPRLCALAEQHGWRVFFLGGQPGTVDESLERLRDRFPGLQLAGAWSPPFGFEHDPAEDRRALQAVLEAKPDLLFLALGAPKQEKFFWRHRAELAGIVALGIGISLDFLTGRVRRAPLWMRRAGLEWLHRLLQEPGRLWRRYLRDFAFPWLVLAQLVREGRQAGGWR